MYPSAREWIILRDAAGVSELNRRSRDNVIESPGAGDGDVKELIVWLVGQWQDEGQESVSLQLRTIILQPDTAVVPYTPCRWSAVILAYKSLVRADT